MRHNWPVRYVEFVKNILFTLRRIDVMTSHTFCARVSTRDKVHKGVISSLSSAQRKRQAKREIGSCWQANDNKYEQVVALLPTGRRSRI